MKLALIGTGRMGAALDAAAAARGHSVVSRVGREENSGGQALTRARLQDADVVLEFTHPDAVVHNLERLADLGIPTVTGTTGWSADRPRLEARVHAGGGALLYAANFSLGAQLLLQAARNLARSLRGLDQFDAHLLEWHHREKVDSPSGTALHLQRALMEEDPDRGWPIVAHRLGWMPGTHAVEVDGRFETLSLTHTVRDRAVFAEGAIFAAEWLAGRRGVFTFEDILNAGDPA
jgi:4-hydroxy-tetrahydrodipicolinate reductase